MPPATNNAPGVQPALAPRATGKRYLHLIPDDKFIDDARAIFEEAAPGAHDYLRLSTDALRYIRSFKPVQLDLRQALRPRVLSVLPEYEVVFVHFLSQEARQIVNSAPAGTRFIWIGWGADYYHLIRGKGQLLLPETRARFARLMPGNGPLGPVRKAARLLRRILERPFQTARQLQFQLRLDRIGANRPGELQLLNRFTYFAPVLREDYDAMVAANPELRPRFVQWNYWTAGIGLLGDDAAEPLPSARNILLGNSATPENNHLEALRMLEGCVGGERKIICPLSYGIPAYADMIANEGQQRLGDQFIALREFMPVDAYLELLRGCSVVAMNHLRQQAMGNIVMMLWLGARVFLNHESPVNKAMESIGVDVYDIRGLPDYLTQDDIKPSRDQVMDIRERIDRRFGRDAILRNTMALLAKAAQ